MSSTFPLSKLRLLLAISGFLLLAAALLADTLRLSAAGFSRGQLLVALIGLGLVAGGMLGQRIVAAYQSLALLLLNTLLLLAILEIGAGVVSWLISGEEEDAPPAILSQPYYADKDWAATYWAEFNAIEKYDYQPYVVWRRPPYTGETIVIDEARHRQTPGAVCTPEAYTVFAFGGSTMWGTGAPDWGTIPAYLQAALDAQLDQPVCVINFGQSAYVSTQSVIELILQLKNGAQPNLVIFYDGINDVYAAYQNGRADQHQNFSQLASVFAGGDDESLGAALARTLRDETYSGRLLDRWFKLSESDHAPITYRTMGVDAEKLAGQIIEEYLANYRFVNRLAQTYDFEFAFFWQPVIGEGSKPLTEAEQQIAAALDPALARLFALTYAQAAALPSENPHLFYLADALDGQADELWIDAFHITPVGNELIAVAMLKAMVNRENDQ